MEESIIRELRRFQDLLVNFLTDELWHKWTAINEEVIEFLEEK